MTPNVASQKLLTPHALNNNSENVTMCIMLQVNDTALPLLGSDRTQLLLVNDLPFPVFYDIIFYFVLLQASG